MEVEVASEYGSDFTPDEEEILHSLLQQAPSATLTEDLSLVLKDIEDNESPRGARVPRIDERHHHQLSDSNQITTRRQTPHVTVKAADDSNAWSNGERPDTCHKSSAD